MKKISFAICAMLMLFGNVSAFNGSFFENASKISNHAERVEANIFTTNTVPPIKLVQVPSQELLIFSDFIYTQHLNMNCQTFNGIRFHGPLKVDYDMSIQQLIDALQKCAGPNVVVKHSKGWLN